ncbi:MAG: helix-turn-helix transcriptional regulator [Duganella sp.]
MGAEFAIRNADQLTGVLQAFRKESGLSQTEVATRMGLTQQKQSYLELNAQSASAERVLMLLSVLGVELVLRRPRNAAASDGNSNPLPW